MGSQRVRHDWATPAYEKQTILNSKWGLTSMTLVWILPCFMLSRFSRVRLCETLWTAACQAPLSMGFSRQEYWSGLPCPPAGDLSVPGVEPKSVKSNLLWQAGSLPLVPLLQQKGHLCDKSFQKRRRLIKSRIRQWRNLSEGFFSLGTRRLLNPLRFPVKMSCKMIGSRHRI